MPTVATSGEGIDHLWDAVQSHREWAGRTGELKAAYSGPMFRYERPQKGRERQFTQFDVECIGTSDPRIDAESVTDEERATFEKVLAVLDSQPDSKVRPLRKAR